MAPTFKLIALLCITVFIIIGVFQFSPSFNNNNNNNIDQQQVDVIEKAEGENDLISSKEQVKLEPTIFISLASYRDAMCSDTINYIYKNAKHPEYIYVGVVDQGAEKIDKIFNDTVEHGYPNSYCYHSLDIPKEWVDEHIRFKSMTSEESKGPTLARFWASKLYKKETYYMQIDSHMRFIKHWDVHVIDDHWKLTRVEGVEIGRGGVPKGILTHYPLPYDHDSSGLPKDDQTHVPNLCKGIFNAEGLMTFNSYILAATEVPKECPFLAAGFFFGTAEFLSTVPYDPHLPNMFEGEEILHTVRLWVNGYRFFAPTMNFCYHFYIRKDQPKFWEDVSEYRVGVRQSVDRAKYILGLDHPHDLSDPKYYDINDYDIKNKSIIQQYWKTYDLDPIAKTHDFNKWCR
ncbi:GlcNAc transferase [Cavenderia fasciculata]|uniref:GlcNAc transferase n=1 Tax=Cavenderia fasciculata TaxID=261658 RepID=F4PR25_CACFS|nr:GlcNAc transferase [Cavenderia fasciculata]EGG22082.1 GlcNAc transferase [Cavenderia fasciculata]|eukprot:XP_004359933.1 GlcNAc transferase [Cavenderia fasciculata]